MSTPIIRRRKKAVEVDTIQWLGDNEADVQAFTGGAAYFYALDPEDRENSDDPEATATVFDRLHSTWVLVYTGQHIVRGVKREYYPIAEDVLAETYETADTPLHAACRAEVLNEAADVAASCVALYESSETAAAAGAMEGLADRFRRMAGEGAVPPSTATEYGISLPADDDGPACVLDPTDDKTDAERRLDRYRDQHPGAALVQRAVTYGAWTDVTEAGDRRG